MTEFTNAVQQALNMVEYTYNADKQSYTISPHELLNLLENVILESIYNPKLRDEVFLDRAQ